MGLSIISLLNTSRLKGFRGLRRNFQSQMQPDFGPGDKTRDRPNTTRNRRDPNRKIQPDSLGQFRVIFSPTRVIQVESWLGTNPTRGQPYL